jgi:hypothetical protein
MKVLLLAAGVLVLTSCADTLPISLDPEKSPSNHTLRCGDGWNDCYTQANRICGSRGFDEVDRVQSERLTSSGRSVSTEIEPETQRNDNRAEVEGRVLTIRCR